MFFPQFCGFAGSESQLIKTGGCGGSAAQDVAQICLLHHCHWEAFRCHWLCSWRSFKLQAPGWTMKAQDALLWVKCGPQVSQAMMWFWHILTDFEQWFTMVCYEVVEGSGCCEAVIALGLLPMSWAIAVLRQATVLRICWCPLLVAIFEHSVFVVCSYSATNDWHHAPKFGVCEFDCTYRVYMRLNNLYLYDIPMFFVRPKGLTLRMTCNNASSTARSNCLRLPPNMITNHFWVRIKITRAIHFVSALLANLVLVEEDLTAPDLYTGWHG